MRPVRKICLLGFGEAGAEIADGLAGVGGLELVAWDRQFDDPSSVPSRQLAERRAVGGADSAGGAAIGCDLVVSVVTAAEDERAAGSVLPGLAPGAWFLDLNSVAPATRVRVARCVDAAGGRYLEGAIMAAIRPSGLAAPILLGGPHAGEFVPVAHAIGFSGLRFCSDQTGVASATKLCRSVIVKGFEALVAESLLAARHFGVEDAVLESLADFSVDADWHRRARYLLQRSLRHGARRADELREAADMLAGAGIVPTMSEAGARRQAWAAAGAASTDDLGLAGMLDAMLARREDGETAIA